MSKAGRMYEDRMGFPPIPEVDLAAAELDRATLSPMNPRRLTQLAKNCESHAEKYGKMI
jgi:hypothetical protein